MSLEIELVAEADSFDLEAGNIPYDDIARCMEFCRGLRTWRACIVSQWNRRDLTFSSQEVLMENPYKGGS
ncbi:hypothetical protein FACS189472_16100 [Alphaproteobacteria bacterium]|nr:hypothetical protein FACS189472_16100 [Alphaproteobacteria bacterium]